MTCMKYVRIVLPKNGLWVREKERIQLVPFETITHIHHSNGESKIFMGGELLKKLRTPLCGLEKKMPESQFFRPHRNFIINKSFVDHYDKEEPVIYFVGGQKIPVSRRKKKHFEVFLNTTN